MLVTHLLMLLKLDSCSPCNCLCMLSLFMPLKVVLSFLPRIAVKLLARIERTGIITEENAIDSF